jgi:hypothetical protein
LQAVCFETLQSLEGQRATVVSLKYNKVRHCQDHLANESQMIKQFEPGWAKLKEL